MIDILISENISGPYVDALCSRFQVSRQPKLWEDQAALLKAVETARVLLVRNNTQVTGEVLCAGKNLIAVGDRFAEVAAQPIQGLRRGGQRRVQLDRIHLLRDRGDRLEQRVELGGHRAHIDHIVR